MPTSRELTEHVSGKYRPHCIYRARPDQTAADQTQSITRRASLSMRGASTVTRRFNALYMIDFVHV